MAPRAFPNGKAGAAPPASSRVACHWESGRRARRDERPAPRQEQVEARRQTADAGSRPLGCRDHRCRSGRRLFRNRSFSGAVRRRLATCRRTSRRRDVSREALIRQSYRSGTSGSNGTGTYVKHARRVRVVVSRRARGQEGKAELYACRGRVSLSSCRVTFETRPGLRARGRGCYESDSPGPAFASGTVAGSAPLCSAMVSPTVTGSRAIW